MKRKATLRAAMIKAQHSSVSNLAATAPTQAWLRWLIAPVACTLALLWTPPPTHAQSTVVVTNANDAGAGSLRQVC